MLLSQICVVPSVGEEVLEEVKYTVVPRPDLSSVHLFHQSAGFAVSKLAKNQMCIIVPRVEAVDNTRIFARLDAGSGRQAVVYAMDFGAPEEVAMVLPIPVRTGEAGTPPADDAVEFVSLEKYPDFFKDLEKGFPQPRASRSRAAAPLSSSHNAVLEVVKVGAFDASFVPSLKDFDRLDAQFRLPQDVWDKVGDYSDYGFAVFKLSKGQKQKAHPMAFWFPTRHEDKLFWPTVHIHDGEVHERAEFHHILYGQGARGAGAAGGAGAAAAGAAQQRPVWDETREDAAKFVDVRKACGIVEKSQKVLRQKINGVHENVDQFLSVA